jgi:hypothetical protein
MSDMLLGSRTSGAEAGAELGAKAKSPVGNPLQQLGYI